VAWRLSITMEAAFCVETLEDALARYGKPDVNTDQGSQFTGAVFTGVLASNGITMHGRQRRLARQRRPCRVSSCVQFVAISDDLLFVRGTPHARANEEKPSRTGQVAQVCV
jgi:hypothetical protein